MKYVHPATSNMTPAERLIDLEFRNVIRHGGAPSTKSPFMFTTCQRCGCWHALPRDDGTVSCCHCDKRVIVAANDSRMLVQRGRARGVLYLEDMNAGEVLAATLERDASDV